MTKPYITLYGISNCDTVKKSRAWFTAQGLAVEFHDFKKQGVPLDQVPRWVAAVGWDRLLNRQGTTWRRMDAPTQEALMEPRTALGLLQEHASVLKRPVVHWRQAGADHISVGWSPDLWKSWSGAATE